jgi:hypothetical protein
VSKCARRKKKSDRKKGRIKESHLRSQKEKSKKKEK